LGGHGPSPRADRSRLRGRGVACVVKVDVMAGLIERGMLLGTARGPIPSGAQVIAGEALSGGWWAHPASPALFAEINAVGDSPDVVRLRLVNGKVTLVHRRVWPALVRVSDLIAPERLAAVEEEHTASGTHRKVEAPFPAWVPPEVVEAAAALTEA